jgi:uncharacterized membrane protein YsdA (DUF1294 family)
MDASWDMIGCVPEGAHPHRTDGVFYAYLRATGVGYFTTMEQRLLQGRAFDLHDRIGGEHLCIVNESFARRFWPGENPVGKRIRQGGTQGNGGWLTVVGLTADTKAIADPRDGEVVGTIYIPLPQAIASGFDEMTFLVKVARDPLALAPAVRTAVARADNRIAVYNITTLDNAAADSRVTERFLFLLVSLFGALALILAGVGVYGLLALQVARRTREFGVRIALGASAAALVRLVTAQSGRLLGLGLVAGACGAWAAVRLLQHTWPEVPAADPFIWLGATATLSLGVVVASWVPARRAGKVDPITALHAE